MIARVLAASLLFTGQVVAQNWERLDGSAVETALRGVTLHYDGARQVFYASGKTLYDNGRPSWGYWTVRGDQYCSQWPPADGWACYALDRHLGDGRLRFVSETGATTESVILE